MKCPDCRDGRKYYGRVDPFTGRTKVTSIRSCDRCGGCGIVNCCEGDQSQPGAPVEPQPRSASEALPTGHHGPTS